MCAECLLSSVAIHSSRSFFLNGRHGVTPAQTILRIWDVFLLEGADYLLLISFYTLKMHEVPIVNARGTAELMSLLANAPRRSFDPDRLLRVRYIGCTTGFDRPVSPVALNYGARDRT